MDIATGALFATSVDLLLGYDGLTSFGHPACTHRQAQTANCRRVDVLDDPQVRITHGVVV
jgi:hypothetical protein